MERTIAAVMHNAFSALAEKQRRGASTNQPPSLREVALRVMRANRVTKVWRGLLDEGCSVKALARDQLSSFTVQLLTHPFEAAFLAAMMGSSPRDPALYPFRGYYRGLKDWSTRTSVLAMFAGFMPQYLATCIDEARPSAVLSPDREFEDFDLYTVQNQFVREFLRWVCYTASHPLTLISSRMLYYGPEQYPSVFSAVKSIIKNEGYKGLFKGYSITLLQGIAAVTFGEHAVMFLDACYPLFYIRQRMMLEQGPVQSPVTMANTVFKESGWKGFFPAFGALMWLIPYQAAALAVTEGLLLATFGFRTHNSPRTTAQRARTALRRWLHGERESDRQQRKSGKKGQ